MGTSPSIVTDQIMGAFSFRHQGGVCCWEAVCWWVAAWYLALLAHLGCLEVPDILAFREHLALLEVRAHRLGLDPLASR